MARGNLRLFGGFPFRAETPGAFALLDGIIPGHGQFFAEHRGKTDCGKVVRAILRHTDGRGASH
jgi:hypothetical protein